MSLSNFARPGMVALRVTVCAWVVLLLWAPLHGTIYQSAATVSIHLDHFIVPAERREIGPDLEAFVQSQEVHDATETEIGFDADFRVFLSPNHRVVVVQARHDDPEMARRAATSYVRTAEALQGRYTEEFGYRLQASRTVDPVERKVQRTSWHLAIGALLGAGAALWTEKKLRAESGQVTEQTQGFENLVFAGVAMLTSQAGAAIGFIDPNEISDGHSLLILVAVAFTGLFIYCWREWRDVHDRNGSSFPTWAPLLVLLAVPIAPLALEANTHRRAAESEAARAATPLGQLEQAARKGCGTESSDRIGIVIAQDGAVVVVSKLSEVHGPAVIELPPATGPDYESFLTLAMKDGKLVAERVLCYDSKGNFIGLRSTRSGLDDTRTRYVELLVELATAGT